MIFTIRTIHCISNSYLRQFSSFFKSYYTVRIRTTVLSLELLLLLPPERSESFSFLPFPLLTSLPDGVIRLFSWRSLSTCEFCPRREGRPSCLLFWSFFGLSGLACGTDGRRWSPDGLSGRIWGLFGLAWGGVAGRWWSFWGGRTTILKSRRRCISYVILSWRIR